MCRLYSSVQLVEQNENKTLEKTHMYMCMFCGRRGTRGRSKESRSLPGWCLGKLQDKSVSGKGGIVV